MEDASNTVPIYYLGVMVTLGHVPEQCKTGLT